MYLHVAEIISYSILYRSRFSRPRMRKGRFRLLDLTKDRQVREKERERKIRMSATNRSRCIGANNIYINVAVLNVSKSRATKRGSCDRSLRDFRRGSDIRTGISYVLADGYIDDSHISGTLITHRREADDTCQKKKKRKKEKNFAKWSRSGALLNSANHATVSEPRPTCEQRTVKNCIGIIVLSFDRQD